MKSKPGESKEKRDAKLVVNAATERIRHAFNNLTEAVVHIELGRVVGPAQEQALEEFAMAMASSMTMADVYGRMRTLDEMRKAAPQGEAGQHSKALSSLTLGSTFAAVFAGDDGTDNINEWLELPFEEAVAAIAGREPALAQGYEEASEAYARMGFALARKTAMTIAEEIQRTTELQELMVQAMTDGLGSKHVVEQAFEMDPKWDENYLRIVAQTNMGSAYVAGRERQMRDPAVAPYIVAHRFVSALLPTTRPNHRAAHGFVAPPEHHVWESISPLLGYQCYCRKQPVFRAAAGQFGIALDDQGRMAGNITRPEGAHADSNSFGRRTDNVVYGGAPGGRQGFAARRSASPLWCACGMRVRKQLSPSIRMEAVHV